MMGKTNFQNAEDLPMIMTSKDVKQLLGINHNGVYELMRRKGFPAVRVSPRRIIIPRDRFLTWLDHAADQQLV